MKKPLIFSILLLSLFFPATAQKTYFTTGSEMIFSLANVSVNQMELDSRLRFTMFYHTGSFINHDFSRHTGLYYGLAVRNVGFITGNETIGSTAFDKVKRRSYSLGLPVGFKVGNIPSKMYFFAGGEYEYMFHYKEKRFQGGDKFKQTAWFTSRTNSFIPSVFFGISFPTGTSVTFKYYLDDFMNKSYVDPLTSSRPYQNMDSRMFYISLSRRVKYKTIVEEISRPSTISM